MNAGGAREYQSAEDNYERIVDPARMAGVFRNLAASRALVSITPADSKQTFNSALIRIDSARGLLWLDEIMPARAHQRILDARRFRVQARLRGIEVRFNAQLDTGAAANENACYLVPFPKTLDYFQRRAHYRVRLAQTRAIPVSLTLAHGEVVTGKLRDISVGGIKAMFTEPQIALAIPGTRIPECVIALPPAASISSELEVRFVERNGQQSSRILGARFSGLDAKLEHTIERYIAELDRENVKRSVLDGD